ncbi:MOSC domain-containing protein [Tessaracoccus defluvii]|uniref:MOSC domain-containing protein n=1 Tax=Tessaracoccus defluvii TaxID=1285901 RepID=A0A7H0H833_9ACTN|nr:MOSC domain-containing protein [Tessaracoccus defluvii]
MQVSEPRQPCYKLAKRWGIDDLVVRVQRTGMSGWYLRVLETGDVGAGDTVARLADSAGPTLREASVVVQGLTDDADLIRRVLAFEGLPTRWRPRIERRLAGGRVDESARERGPAADR